LDVNLLVEVHEVYDFFGEGVLQTELELLKLPSLKVVEDESGKYNFLFLILEKGLGFPPNLLRRVLLLARGRVAHYDFVFGLAGKEGGELQPLLRLHRAVQTNQKVEALRLHIASLGVKLGLRRETHSLLLTIRSGAVDLKEASLTVFDRMVGSLLIN